jgi:hypothetical protein
VEYVGTLAVWGEDLTERVALRNVRMKTSQYDKSPKATAKSAQTAFQLPGRWSLVGEM